MNKKENLTKPINPRDGANIFSIITFAYTFPVFKKGNKKEFDEDDIPEHLGKHDSKTLGDKLEKAWKREESLNKNPSLWRAIRNVFGLEFILLGFLVMFIELVVKMSQPLALSQLIKYYTQTDNKISKNQAFMYAGIIVGASVIHVFIGHNYMLALYQFGMRMRIACCSLIYRKSLRLQKSVLGGTTIGQMVNLLSNDVNRCDRAVMHAHNLWLCPLETLVILGILYALVGPVSTIGIFFMASFFPIQMYMGKKTSEYRLKTAIRTDERVRLMNEIISGIQVIKMYTWEKPFANLVATVRRFEIRNIRITSYIKGLILAFAGFTTRFATFLTILVYVLLGNELEAEYVFVVSSFYSVLRQAMTVHFPGGITEIAEFRISVSRLQNFLLYKEIESCSQLEYKINNKYDSIINNQFISTKNQVSVDTAHEVEIIIKNISARWLETTVDNTLDDIDFRVQDDQLVTIIGPVGSGKSSLLHVILKELPILKGSVDVYGTVSYTSQEPWVFAGSIRQNIIFGQHMDEQRYQQVLSVCALEQDLCLLPYGDQTLVGERGVTLSGGQKARVNLARAVYKKADIYLLDDPLSAVDTHVGKHLYEECITKFLSKKCVVLVTHQLQYLKNVKFIYLIENGKIRINGSYQTLMESDIHFTKQLEKNKDEELSGDFKANNEVLHFNSSGAVDAPIQTKEQRSTGHIGKDVYNAYFRAAGSLLFGLVVIFFFIITQVFASATDYFLTFWVNLEQSLQNPENTITNQLLLTREECIIIYTSLVVFLVIFTLSRSFTFFKYCMTASKNLHNEMFSNIVYAPMRFFDTNSSGRILNRFSKDMGQTDEVLPMVGIDCIQIGLTVLGVTVMVSIVNPWLLIATAVILTIFYFLRTFYLTTTRSIKRLEGITRSPVFAHMNASLQGLTTIRAFKAEHILEEEFDNHQDLHSSVYYLYMICTRAFGFCLDFICVIYIGLVTFSFFLLGDDQYGGNVGLAITQAISLTGMFQWGMRQWSELETNMTSIERVVEFTKIPKEIDHVKGVVPSQWPTEGNINFVSVSLRYSENDPYVLKNLTFNICSEEKIGIVGRTGAGKSSLIYALFQLTETEGSLLIDNIDISQIPLNLLRSKISIIPQEPVLFSGTLRKNLDPFDEYSDVDLWNALKEVELKDVVAELPAGLNSAMCEGGSNFSVGQRQLICLARAIIKKNKILILDEATANVDPLTDSLIQNTIRKKFLHCTVLTIAHRLNTVMDSDKILVIDAGSIIEFDHPYNLLQNTDGLFYSMIYKSGNSQAESLFNIAKDSYQKKMV